MTRWLVLVPEGDEVKYVRSPSVTKPLACDLDTIDRVPEFTDQIPLWGLPVYDGEFES